MTSSKRVLTAIALAAVCAVGLPAHADQCRLPPATSKIPDGHTSNSQQMVTAMQTIRQYNSDVQTYLKCLNFEVRQNELSQSAQVSLHNSAVDQLTRVADAFNRQVRIFKSTHG